MNVVLFGKTINHTIDKVHKDFQLLKDIFGINNVYGSSTISCGKTTKRHYIREYGFRYWDTAEGYEKTKSIQIKRNGFIPKDGVAINNKPFKNRLYFATSLIAA